MNLIHFICFKTFPKEDFSDSRTNPFEEGEDEKNHGVPNGPRILF